MNLYKYVSSNLWKKILQNKIIRFTQPTLFNDPFEIQPFYESLAETDAFKEQLNKDNVSTILEEQFDNAYKDLPTETQNFLTPEILNEFAKAISPFAIEQAPFVIDAFMLSISKGISKGLGESTGILSLTEKHDNLLMWAHYAENHKGIVIGFDGENGFFHHQRTKDDECNYIRKVTYSEERPAIQLTTIEDMADIFLIKSKEWEYEQEWRMLKPLNDANETIQVNEESICLFSFPPKCVTEIILGCRISPSNRKDILEYLVSDEEYSHVQKYEAILDEREFKLNIIPAKVL